MLRLDVPVPSWDEISAFKKWIGRELFNESPEKIDDLRTEALDHLIRGGWADSYDKRLKEFSMNLAAEMGTKVVEIIAIEAPSRALVDLVYTKPSPPSSYKLPSIHAMNVDIITRPDVATTTIEKRENPGKWESSFRRPDNPRIWTIKHFALQNWVDNDKKFKTNEGLNGLLSIFQKQDEIDMPSGMDVLDVIIKHGDINGIQAVVNNKTLPYMDDERGSINKTLSKRVTSEWKGSNDFRWYQIMMDFYKKWNDEDALFSILKDVDKVPTMKFALDYLLMLKFSAEKNYEINDIKPWLDAGGKAEQTFLDTFGTRKKKRIDLSCDALKLVIERETGKPRDERNDAAVQRAKRSVKYRQSIGQCLDHATK